MYEELREKIAQKLYAVRFLSPPWENRKPHARKAFYHMADEILSIIADGLGEKINNIFDHCYTEGSPDYPDLMVFQRQKALNEIMVLFKPLKKEE